MLGLLSARQISFRGKPVSVRACGAGSAGWSPSIPEQRWAQLPHSLPDGTQEGTCLVWTRAQWHTRTGGSISCDTGSGLLQRLPLSSRDRETGWKADPLLESDSSEVHSPTAFLSSGPQQHFLVAKISFLYYIWGTLQSRLGRHFLADMNFHCRFGQNPAPCWLLWQDIWVWHRVPVPWSRNSLTERYTC